MTGTKMLNKIKSKMKQDVIIWGLKGFYARTPVWAKHTIIAVVTGYAALLIWMSGNPGLLPDHVSHYVMVGVPFLMMALKAFGITPAAAHY